MDRARRGAAFVPTQGDSVMGERKKPRRSAPGPSMMPMMMMPWAQQAQPGPATSSTSSSSSSEDAETAEANKKDAKLWHTGATFLGKLAKIRLQELAESGCAEFDSLYTSGLERGDLCRLLWLTTGVRPNDKTVNFRVMNYKELREQFRVAKDSVAKKNGPGAVRQDDPANRVLTPVRNPTPCCGQGVR